MKRVDTQAVWVGLALGLPLGLTACNSGGSSEEPVDFGLDGDWTAQVEDRALSTTTQMITIDGENITQRIINGHDVEEIGLIWKEADRVFGLDIFPRPEEPEPSEDDPEHTDLDDLTDSPEDTDAEDHPPPDDEDAPAPVYGRLISNADKNTLMAITPEREVGVFQPGQPPISDATLLDLIGHWEGQVIGRLFHPEGDLYRYEHHVTCATGAIGTCVLTAWETARHDDGRYALMADSQGNPIRDTAGLQTTLSLVPRGRLFFDLEFTNTLGHQGTGALMMSPDKDGFGLYLCPPENDDMKACEYGLFERR